MALDPNIALQVGQPVQPLDPLKAYGQVLTLKHLVDQQQLGGLQAEALRAKMGRDAEDQQFDTALKRIKVLQGAAAGLSALPSERRPMAWPSVRSMLAKSGINDMPEQYPGDDIVDTYTALGTDPNKMLEVARASAQQKAFAEAQAAARNATLRGVAPAPDAAPTQGAPATNGTDLVAPPANTVGMRSYSMDPSYYWRLADFASQNPSLAGTKYAEDAVNTALKIEKDTRDAEGSGVQLVKGDDGRMYTFKNGELVSGPVSTGRDPNAAFWAGDDGQPVPNAVAQNFQRAKAREGATVVNVDNKQQEASAKQIGEDYGKRFGEIQRAEFSSRGMVNKLTRLTQILADVDTGKLTPLGTQVAGYAKALGFDIDPKLGNKEAAMQLESMLSLDFAEKMKGPLSDSDRRFVQSISSMTDKSTKARALQVETMKRLAERDAQIAKMARDYKKKYGKFDEGFDDQMAIWSDQNPLFPDMNTIDAELKKRGNR